MLVLLVFPVYVLAGVLAVSERSLSVPEYVGIIALGAFGLALCALVALAEARRLSRVVGALLAFLIGGTTTYAMSCPPEEFGWMVAITVWILALTILVDLALAGDFIWRPVGEAIDFLGGQDDDGTAAAKRGVVERAAIRALTPVLLIASVLAAILIAANISDVPSVAFGNHVVFTGLLVILFFYGTLLVLLPLVRAMASGEWPVELTTSGPRYPEERLGEAGEAGEKLRQRLQEFETRSVRLDTRLEAEIKDLRAEAEIDAAAQEEVNDGAVERIAALEAQVRELRSRIGPG